MIKKGLKVEVLTGKDKKKQGEIIEILWSLCLPFFGLWPTVLAMFGFIDGVNASKSYRLAGPRLFEL